MYDYDENVKTEDLSEVVPYNGVDYNNYNNYNKKEKKKSGKGFVRKAFSLLISAVVFGAVAGSVMVGVNYAGGKYLTKEEKEIVEYDIPTVSGNITQVSTNIPSDELDILGVTTSPMNVESVAAAALPAMVELNGVTKVSSSYYYGSYNATTSGTGIIVGKNENELLILTNAHVINDVDTLKCVFIDGSSVDCTVKGSKSDKDIAVCSVLLSDISAETIGAIAIAELEDNSAIIVGQQVVAIGNALGEGQSVTTGIISATDRSITVDGVEFSGLIMTDAAINSGNSGGALLNSQGKVIAVNFAKTSTSGVEGMAYSIPVSNVKDIIDSLMSKQTRTKVNSEDIGYLGISGLDITSSTAAAYGYPVGLYISKVVEGSAAERAGLEAKDIIVGFDNQTISSMSNLTNILQYYRAGEVVSIDYYHIEGNKYVLKTVDITLGRKVSS